MWNLYYYKNPFNNHSIQEIYFHHLIFCYPCFSKDNVSAYSLVIIFCMLENDIKVKKKCFSNVFMNILLQIRKKVK